MEQYNRLLTKCFYFMSTETQYLTNEKFAELTKELEHLKTVRRKEVADQLEYAKKLGDLSENAEYHQAREDQAEIEDRIDRLENLLKNATIMIVGNFSLSQILSLHHCWFRRSGYDSRKSFQHVAVGLGSSGTQGQGYSQSHDSKGRGHLQHCGSEISEKCNP